MSESLEIECPVCQQRSSVPISYAGKQGKCPGCLSTIRVPDLDAAPAASPVEIMVQAKPTPAREPRTEGPRKERPTKVCPDCGEDILAQAKKCRYCGEFLDKTLQQERRSARERTAPKWAFPTVVMVLLPVQAVLVCISALACALVQTDIPSLTLWATSVFFSLAWGVIALTSIAKGNRLRLLSIVLATGLHLVVSFAVAAGLDLPGSPPSPLFGALHGALGLFLAGVFYRAVKAHRAKA